MEDYQISKIFVNKKGKLINNSELSDIIVSDEKIKNLDKLKQKNNSLAVRCSSYIGIGVGALFSYYFYNIKNFNEYFYKLKDFRDLDTTQLFLTILTTLSTGLIAGIITSIYYKTKNR